MNRRVLTIIVAVLLAVLGTTAVLVYVNNADARALEGIEAKTVLVAAEPIPAGTEAASVQNLVRAERMPVNSVPSDVLAAIDADMHELVTSTDIQQGQLLTRGMLVKKSQQGEVVLPQGKLAVTIPVEAGSQSNDTLQAGFQVAVFDTFTAKRGAYGNTQNGEQLAFGEGKSQATRLVLPRVEVIAVRADKESDDSSSGFGEYLVTVAVSQAEAEKLIHVLNTGTVSLAQVNDASNVETSPGVDNNNLFQQSTSED